MPCSSCFAKLGIFSAKRRVCNDCSKAICTKCAEKVSKPKSSGRGGGGGGGGGGRQRMKKVNLCSSCVLVEATVTATAAPFLDVEDEFVATAATAAAAATTAVGADARTHLPPTPGSSGSSGRSNAGSGSSDGSGGGGGGGGGSSAGLGGDWASRLGAGFESFLADQLLNTLLGSVNEEQSEADIKREQAAKRKQHTEMLEERANARLLVTAKSEGDFGKLRVAQLKSILKQNYVEHDSCVEKQELVELVLELWQTSQKESAAPKEEVCKVCMDQAVSCVFLECGHLVCCLDCGKQVEECPICRQTITRVVPVFRS